MRILHLFSDFKWTGPAEPVLNICLALRDRGFDVTLACRKPEPDARQSMAQKAREQGIEPELGIHLNRYWSPRDTIEDLVRLPRFIRDGGYDLVHTHLSHDHSLGGWAARRAGKGITVIRTNHKGVPFKNGCGRRWLLRRLTDAYVGFSRAAAEEDRKTIGLPPEKVFVINPAVDLDRFNPARPFRDIRPDYGLSSDHVLAGIVARAQRHRRFEVLLEAVRLASAEVPELRVLVIGRGTHIQKVAKDPAKEMGLENIVLFPGYRSDDFVDHVQCFDFKVFLVPGSDGTCRAVREAMALGKPVVAARRGMLPELIPHEEAGLIIDDTPENLAAALVRMTRDTELRRRLGQGARNHALVNFSLKTQAEAVADMYRSLERQKKEG